MPLNERLLKLATADPKTLARIDQVLAGEDSTTAATRDVDCRSVTYTEAARRLGVSRPTIYRLVKAKKLKTISLAGTDRILVRSIVAFTNGESEETAKEG